MKRENRISKTSVPLIFTQELTLLFLKTKIIYIFQKKPSTTRHFFSHANNFTLNKERIEMFFIQLYVENRKLLTRG